MRVVVVVVVPCLPRVPEKMWRNVIHTECLYWVPCKVVRVALHPAHTSLTPDVCGSALGRE